MCVHGEIWRTCMNSSRRMTVFVLFCNRNAWTAGPDMMSTPWRIPPERDTFSASSPVMASMWNTTVSTRVYQIKEHQRRRQRKKRTNIIGPPLPNHHHLRAPFPFPLPIPNSPNNKHLSRYHPPPYLRRPPQPQDAAPEDVARGRVERVDFPVR